MIDQIPGVNSRRAIDNQSVRAAFNRFADVILTRNFNCYFVNVAALFARAPDGHAEAARNCRVIRLDANAIVEAISMIHSTTQQHRIFLKHTQAGRGLACIGDLCFRAFDSVDKLARHRGNPRQMLQEIKRRALARKQHVRKAAGPRDHFAGFNLFTIRRKGFELLLRIERDEDLFRRFQSGHDHLFAGHKSAARPGIAHQYALRRDVAAAQVLTQKQTNARIERAFVKPIHLSCLCSPKDNPLIIDIRC